MGLWIKTIPISCDANPIIFKRGPNRFTYWKTHISCSINDECRDEFVESAHMPKLKFLVLLSVFIFLSACVAGIGIRISNEDVTEFKNSELVLLKPLSIPAGHAGISIQYGKLSMGKQLDKYYANCDFELTKIVSVDTVIEPDSFIIYQIRKDESYVQRGYLQYASMFGIGSDDSVMAVDYITELYLKSERQPIVYRLTCSHWEEPTFPQHLSLQQINETLKGWFKISKIH